MSNISQKQKANIKHIYRELIGYLNQAPSSVDIDYAFVDKSMWELPNSTSFAHKVASAQKVVKLHKKSAFRPKSP